MLRLARTHIAPSATSRQLRTRKMSTKTKLRKPITFVTGNQNKLAEVSAILGESIPLVNKNLDLVEYQGDVDEVAAKKCSRAALQVRGPVIVEDTSLCFNALGGLPGPYIKWFLESCGHEGLNKMLDGFEDRSAYAQCLFAFCASPRSKPIIFKGRTDGKIVAARAGEGPVFGWDPIFEPVAADQAAGISSPQTYAEMSKEHKNSISHRYRALEKLKAHILENFEAMDPQDVSAEEQPEKSTPKKSRKSRKPAKQAAAVQATASSSTSAAPTEASTSGTASGNTPKNGGDAPANKRGRGKKNAATQTTDTSSSTAPAATNGESKPDVDAAKPKRGRGKKTAATTEETKNTAASSNGSPAASVENDKQSGRGNSTNGAEAKPARPPRRAKENTGPVELSTTTVHVTRFPSKLTEEQLTSIFSKYNPTSTTFFGRKGRLPPRAFIHFADQSAQTAALAVNDQDITIGEIPTFKIRVEVARKKPEPKPEEASSSTAASDASTAPQ